jgi:NAD(P)-dependent dehydrogenase (short-subunit alcohol dehydrogenase family)
MEGAREGRTVLITGASRGIGRATAVQLAAEGARVVLLCRTEEGGRAVADEIAATCGGRGEAHVVVADLRSLTQVREAVREVKERFDALHVLVNNAGVVVPTRRLTEDNIEETFAVNHVAHFVLTVELLDLLESSGTAECASRIVTLSSQAHHDGYMRWHDLRFKQNFAPYRAYAMSKLAGILLTRELARRLAGTRVTANAMHPGRVATGFGIAPTGWRGVVHKMSQSLLPKARDAARGVVYLATSPELEGTSGEYFVKGKPAAVSGFARDHGLARRIWTISEHLAGIRLMEFAA